MKRFAMISLAVVVTACTINACSSVPEDALYGCNPDAIRPDPGCLKQGLTNVDAGTDAESDAASDAASLRSDAACKARGGECVALKKGPEAASWSEPGLVWFGPASEKPTECPFKGSIQLERYAGINAPPLNCASCECEESTGNCTGVPDSISLGTTMCMMGGISTPFDGSVGWDGNCTNANAIPAGAQCPPGSGTPCVQSIAWSALPGPQNEACAVKVNPVPSFNAMTTSWEKAAVACDSSMARDLCGDGAQECLPEVFSPWVQCVWRPGKFEPKECPENYVHSLQVMYPHEPIDTRTCSACSCGEPAGSTCVANLRIFKDSTCSTEILNQPISSDLPDCDPIFPVGSAVGSKSVTDHLYLPGTCAVSGGEPVGEAVEDEKQPTTFCCRFGKVFAD